MRKQAHDAINKVTASEDTLRMHDELDRLGGKTHLISPHPTYDHDRPCAAERRKATALQNGHGGPNGNINVCEPLVQPDMIHPTIMQDMRAFDVAPGAGSADAVDLGQIQFPVDFPSDAFDPAQADFALFPDFDFGVGGTAGYGIVPPTPATVSSAGLGATPSTGNSSQGASPDVWMNGQGPAPGSVSTPAAATPASNGLPAGFELNGNGPPVLDATWQAFVEQLGF